MVKNHNVQTYKYKRRMYLLIHILSLSLYLHQFIIECLMFVCVCVKYVNLILFLEYF